MKRILSTVIAATFSLALFAQDNTAILNKIKEKAPSTISSGFTETRSSVSAPKDCKTLTGKLEFKTPEFLSMEYDNGELFKIDGNRMNILRGEKNLTFDLAKNKPMKNLSHLLIYAFRGMVQELVDEQDTTLLISSDNGEYIITLAAKVQAVKGYKNATFRYDSATGRIKSMYLVEFNGKSTGYELK